MGYDLETIKDYIQVRKPWEIINDIVVLRWSVLMSGPMSLIPCFKHPTFQAIIIIICLIILIWGWIESRDIEKHQKTHCLYFGVSSFLLSVMFFLGSIGAIEYEFHWMPVKAALWVGVGYLSVLLVGGYVHVYNLRKGYFAVNAQNEREKKQWWLRWLIPMLPGIMLILTLGLKNMFGNAYSKGTWIAIPLISYLCSLGMIGYIHKYYLMKKYEWYVRVFHLTQKNDIKTVKWTTLD